MSPIPQIKLRSPRIQTPDAHPIRTTATHYPLMDVQMALEPFKPYFPRQLPNRYWSINQAVTDNSSLDCIIHYEVSSVDSIPITESGTTI